MITKTGSHAVRALTALALLPSGEWAGAAAIARRIDSPPNYLGKLLRLLAREGLVASQKGAGGGFRLARPPESIRLIDVIEPIEHVRRWEACFLGGVLCSEEDPCAVHDRWVELRDGYLALLTETSIADLVGRPTEGGRRA